MSELLQFKGGDANDPHNYALSCTCGIALGLLDRFRPNAQGFRSVLCPRCSKVVIVDGSGQVKVADWKDLVKT
jgi:hypothetical protein